MTCKSHRGLIDCMAGLIEGVGVKFGEPLQVRKLNDDEVRVVFP